MSIKRMLCFFGRHSRAREMLRLASEDGLDVWEKQVSFCKHCHKILFIGYFPPEHPNCRCQINGPGDEDPALLAPKEIIHQMMEEWQKKEHGKW